MCVCVGGGVGSGSCHSMDMKSKVEDNLLSLAHTLFETTVYSGVCQASLEASEAFCVCFHLPVGALATSNGFTFVLGILTQVLMVCDECIAH